MTGQLTGVKYDATTPDGTPASPLKQTAFDFDAVGNREVVTQTTGTSAPVNTSYTRNSLNQYTAVGAGSVTSDTNGNLATYVGGTNAYDAQNRLISASSGTNAVSLAYDGLNRVVSRTVNGTATHFVYDKDWNVIEEYDNGGTQLAAMAYGATTDEPIFRWASGYILSYYHQDALGNVTTLTDLSGIPVESYRYDAFGKATIYDPYLSLRTVSFFGNPYMFTGREFVPEVGIYLYRNRVYSAEFGRFLQTDPIGFSAGDVNLYRYVGNNPINYVDPLGLKLVPYAPEGSGYTQGEAEQALGAAREYLKGTEAGAILDRLDALERPIVITFNDRLDKTATRTNTRSGNIDWNPKMGVCDEKGNRISPALALGHEGDHVEYRLKHPHGSDFRRGTPDEQFGNKEERRVITGSEHPTAGAKGEGKRISHEGFPFKVSGPTSNVSVK